MENIFESIILFKSTAYKIAEIFCIILVLLEKHKVRKNVLSTVEVESALSKDSNVKSNTYWRYSNPHIIYKDFYITVKSGSVAKRVSAKSKGNIYRRNKYQLYVHGISYSIIRGIKWRHVQNSLSLRYFPDNYRIKLVYLLVNSQQSFVISLNYSWKLN
jgi:hypothetical protein